MGKPQQNKGVQGALPKNQTPQGTHTQYDTAGDEQRTDRSNKQQNQADRPQGIWFPKHPEYAGHGVSGLLGFEGSASQPKI